jgi:hypothetical protein
MSKEPIHAGVRYLEERHPGTGRWKPFMRTPAGARLEIRRGPRWVDVGIDRWGITDASPAQQVAVARLGHEYADRCFAQKKRNGKEVHTAATRTVWHITAPAGDKAEVVRQLLAIEALGATVPSDVGGEP